MSADTNKPQNENNSDFGLPKAEFKPIESTGNSKWLKITIGIAAIVLVIGIGVVILLFQRSSSTHTPDFMANTLENQRLEEEEEGIEPTTTDVIVPGDAMKSKAEVKDHKSNVVKKAQENNASPADDSDDAALAELDKISNSFITKPERKPSSFIEQLRAGEFNQKHVEKEEAPVEEEAPITLIHAPKGLYYVILVSHIDKDLSMDYAQKLTQQNGVHVKILLPTAGEHFSRVAIAQEKTYEEAVQKATALKVIYGEKLWIKKF
eukprot:gene331-423_t